MPQTVSHLNLVHALPWFLPRIMCLGLHPKLPSDDEKLSATAEIARVGGQYAVHGHSRSLILLPIESLYATAISE